MGNISAFDISASGIYAQRVRMDTIANNIANADSTRTANGGPYRRQTVQFSSVYQNAIGGASNAVGVKVDGIAEDSSDFRIVHDPGHPDADADGNVKMPNVNVVEEMVNLVSATRAFEANITVMNATKSMLAASIELGK